jgi:putative hemolysin
MEYLKMTESAYLFGCASLRSLSALQVAVLCEYFERNAFLGKDFGVQLKEDFAIPGLARNREFVSRSWGVFLEEKIMELMSPLFRSYLKIGSLLFENPAWDKKLKSVDFFTVLKISDMNSAFSRRYGL